ncbi:glycosyltransferase [Polynucleobacter paneuropaeus]|nr:glycosyltransferase [Polynucleobacter paneuropaeus]
MKIIHIIISGDVKKAGGIAYASVKLALEQANLNMNVSILEVSPACKSLLEINNSRVTYLNSIYKKYLSQCLFVWIMCKGPHTIFHFHGVWSIKYIPLLILILIRKSKFVISPHGNLEPSALKQKKIKKLLARKLCVDYFLVRASAFWACSQKEVDSIKLLYHDAKVVIVPIGVGDPVLVNTSLPESWGLAGKKIILVISRLSPEKGILNLVRAWDRLRSSDWHILIAGPDQEGYQKLIENEIRRLELKSFFTFLGYVDEGQKSLLYSNADLFVLPSLSENFGIVVAEAMSFGIPVLTTKETPWGEIALDQGCLCVSPTPSGILSGLEYFLGLSTEDRKKFSSLSADFIKSRFSWAAIAKLSEFNLCRLLKNETN